MSDTYSILFLGDVMGKPGRDAIESNLPGLVAKYKPLFVIINGENAAGGFGITPDIADEMFAMGADAITLGNHAFNKREIYSYLDSDKPIVRPINLPDGLPGRGSVRVDKAGISLEVTNACGRVFMDGYDDPFRALDLWHEEAGPHWFVDFHGEATSEKVAMAWHLDGRATAVVGTHTHVQTNDARILPNGTAAITDVGMCGPHDGVIGMDRAGVLAKFRTSMPSRFEVSKGPGILHGVVVTAERATGRATQIIAFRTESSYV